MDIQEIIQKLNYSRLINLHIIPPGDSPIYTLPKKRLPQWVNGDVEVYLNYLHGVILRGCAPQRPTDQYLGRLREQLFDQQNFQIDKLRIHQGIHIQPSACTSQWIVHLSKRLKPDIEDYLLGLSMLAVIRSSGEHINYLGIVYPAHGEYTILDCSSWDSHALYTLLQTELEYLSGDSPVDRCPLERLLTPTTGRHISYSSMTFPDNVAYQIFLKGDLPFIKSRVSQSTGKCFIHTPFTINLCNPGNYPRHTLIQEVQGGVYVGAHGVVVHLGATKDLPMTVALQNMADHLRQALQYATAECPILLETSAAEGTECCSSIEELLAFLGRFTMDDHLGLCVDTCHVFAAGYPPAVFLKSVLPWVKLVHFNDSRRGRGHRRDLHAQPGSGEIGYTRLAEVRDICVAHHIPMLIE